MVKTVLSLTLLGTLLTTSVAQAATADSVRTSLMTATGLIADAVEPSPVKGIWEVQIQGRIFYVDDEAKYVLAGANIIETATQKNLTNERLREIARENWSKWPLQDAVKQVYGKGERQIVVFSDANCQYCRAMESVWEQVGNLTVYTFITPLIRGEKINREIVCSSDPSAAWHAWMGEGKMPAPAPMTCDKSVLDRNLQMVRKLGITGAPTFFFPSGDRMTGAMSAMQLEKLLAATAGS